ncbi:unnamed protein product [Fusarium venenatum]|uniref:Uncharacterized protein n=1 Tax=Fusarium venenatum TaxID=56646 RepID=A0A2L2TYF4_9HYPO|nr:uncharacterized protein FVRRES_02487 [Fusarium venenatum]CEI65975.1 unnamed protein product [Fusarium venenatum]
MPASLDSSRPIMAPSVSNDRSDLLFFHPLLCPSTWLGAPLVKFRTGPSSSVSSLACSAVRLPTSMDDRCWLENARDETETTEM